MLNDTIITAVVMVYLLVLIYAGWRSNRGGQWGITRRAVVYGLSLATLSTAWTFFGAVGDASKGSWLFLSNAFGPIIAATLGYPAWIKIVRLAKLENSGSIADFMAARFGKSRLVGVTVAVVASLAALPYVALQVLVLKEVWQFAIGVPDFGLFQTMVLVATLIGLAIVFGARQPSLTHQNRGFVAMIALESSVKIAAIVTAAAACLYLLERDGPGIAIAVSSIPSPHVMLELPFGTLLILCTVTTFTLPRQFHLSFVTVEKVEDARRGVWLFPAYFALWAIATLVIANSIKGGLLVPDAPRSLQTLAIPLEHGMTLVAFAVFLGGLSAGAAMVIVELTAISAMVSNEIVLPMLSTTGHNGQGGKGAGQRVVLVRRVSIIALGTLAWLFYLLIEQTGNPTQLGVIALAASAQLFPGLIAGIYWKRAHANGVIGGIVAGMSIWALFVVLPVLSARSAPLAGSLWPVPQGLGLELLVLTSLAVNALVVIGLSLAARPRLIDTMQAQRFVHAHKQGRTDNLREFNATVGDLRDLLSQFVGDDEARKALLNFRAGTGHTSFDDLAPITPAMAIMAEHVLAGAIGTTSARSVVAMALAVGNQDRDDVRQLLDEAGHAVTFSRDILQLTLDGLSHAVGVVDSDLRLVAWNRNFLELLAIPADGIHVGQSVLQPASVTGRDVLSDDVSAELAAKTDCVMRRRSFRHEFAAGGGHVIQFTGTPIADENFVLTFADITEIREAERVLAQGKEELEDRVEERTRELTKVNRDLEQATDLAERATRAQRRFVAAASHDLVQPLHAARIFIGNVLAEKDAQHTADEKTVLALSHADHAIEAAHRMLRALLSLSQLELGAVRPHREAFEVSSLLSSLVTEFESQADTKGVELVCLPTTAWIRTDRDLLRSVLQNLLVNAIRYTRQGRVVLAARRSGDDVRIEVRDSGIGMAPDQIAAAFGEFERLSEGQRLAEGSGLGLAIVARIAQALDLEVKVHSRPDRGSVFSIRVPRAEPERKRRHVQHTMVDLSGLRVLCIDDEPDILVGTEALIRRWGGEVISAPDAESALGLNGEWDVVLADYGLGQGMNGLELLDLLAGRARVRVLVTAASEEELGGALNAGISVMTKPVSPLLLQEFLISCSGQGECNTQGYRVSANS
ncbi:ATP-binding protein [Novosphingobium album (ex Hu et al. 2023)]|uniref:histidine kinase n=1 Tax=Novosphingobium album (ex Hu et al. 2023) TaxID=2930093 RepID=A0ABT0B5A3_9SPHN|nr:ATP-binding protein [Novosphingobium album (ex Hu et al. 2023)]MCJ2180193.1 PAS domain-containing hybrid sensor histidine kinase/response regulator [Novosphingobium album (ex Hu et al. 2023)]